MSGWKLQGCQSTFPGTAGTRVTVGSGVVLAHGQYYLFTKRLLKFAVISPHYPIRRLSMS